MRAARRLVLLCLLSLLLALAAACGRAGAAGNGAVSATPPADATPGGDVTVFAAASLTGAFTRIGQQFEQAHAGMHVSFNFAGSQTLRAQLAQGARADVFASADEAMMRGAQDDGSIDGTPAVFVENRLVVIVPKDNPARIATLQDLAQPGVKLVLAQPSVPVGNYARQSLARMSQAPTFGADFERRALANLVSEEANVKQVVAKVQLGEADAGIVYATDVTPAVKPRVTMIAIPDALNVVARYPIATVTDAPNAAGARLFMAYVLSPAGQAILRADGFAPAGPAAISAGSAAHG